MLPIANSKTAKMARPNQSTTICCMEFILRQLLQICILTVSTFCAFTSYQIFYFIIFKIYNNLI